MHAVQHANVVHTVSQILTMVSLVAAKRGVAFVPHSATLLGIQRRRIPAAGRAAQTTPWSCTPSGTATSGIPRSPRLLQDLEFRGN